MNKDEAIAALKARRAARGLDDPVNRLTHTINRLLAAGAEPIVEKH
ncbi:hypothetical protein [Sphingosinicella sp. BN140058]|nr:hypothetical protein [Sphingosinicella sp. BN140058]